jgi:hypothetical protein
MRKVVLDAALEMGGGSFNGSSMTTYALSRSRLPGERDGLIFTDQTPVLLGEGIPLFPSGFPQREFSLVENKTYSQGLITLKYKRAGSKAKGKS